MMEFRSGGRKVSQTEFFQNLEKNMLDSVVGALERRVRGAAASIVDPETGRSPDVFVRRAGKSEILVTTKGSSAYARELERALGLKEGAVTETKADDRKPHVYLAHASADKGRLAEPLATALRAQGIEVWLDKWEIRSGDSLRRKMEEGLGACTHFVVLLTENSIGRPWVETEIDVGFTNAVEGKAKFIGLRVGVEVAKLSPFLQTRLCPPLDVSDQHQVDELVADILGVSRKPPLGSLPSYVKPTPPGLARWSPSACAVAEYLVKNSQHGTKFDPQVNTRGLSEALGMPIEDVRLGKLDLLDAGLIEESGEVGLDPFFWPQEALFVEFDRFLMDFDNEKDAVELVNRLLSEKVEVIDTENLAAKFPLWTIRRMNSALVYLDAAGAIRTLDVCGGPYITPEVRVTDRTRKFARNHQ